MRIRDGKSSDPWSGMERVGLWIRDKTSRIRNTDSDYEISDLHGLAGVWHALHVSVYLVQALLHRLKGGQEVAVDLQVASLYFAA